MKGTLGSTAFKNTNIGLDMLADDDFTVEENDKGERTHLLFRGLVLPAPLLTIDFIFLWCVRNESSSDDSHQLRAHEVTFTPGQGGLFAKQEQTVLCSGGLQAMHRSFFSLQLLLCL